MVNDKKITPPILAHKECGCKECPCDNCLGQSKKEEAYLIANDSLLKNLLNGEVGYYDVSKVVVTGKQLEYFAKEARASALKCSSERCRGSAVLGDVWCRECMEKIILDFQKRAKPARSEEFVKHFVKLIEETPAQKGIPRISAQKVLDIYLPLHSEAQPKTAFTDETVEKVAAELYELKYSSPEYPKRYTELSDTTDIGYDEIHAKWHWQKKARSLLQSLPKLKSEEEVRKDERELVYAEIKFTQPAVDRFDELMKNDIIASWLESEEATDMFYPAYKEEHDSICTRPMKCVFQNIAAKLRSEKEK